MSFPSLSITWRARLLSALLSALALAALVFLAQLRIRAVLYAAVDRALQRQAAGFGGWGGGRGDDRSGHRGPPEGGGPGGFHGGGDGHREPPPLDFGTVSLQAPRRLGAGSARTREGNPPWSAAGFEAAKKSGEDLREETAPDGAPLRVYSILRDGAVTQTAATTAETEAALGEIRGALLALLPPLALLSGFLGALLSDLALAPVRRITRAVGALQPSRLADRLPAPGGGDTFDKLVLGFNGLLGRLEGALARQRRFTADASHELRTPLATIKAATSLLLEEPESLTDLQRRTLTRADKTADRAARLVTDLLLLARSESGALPISVAPTDLDVLLGESAGEALAGHAGPHAPLAIENRASPSVKIDAAIASRILVNLASNALRHTPESGKITLRAERREAGLTLSVADTGEGIAAQHLARLGEPFYRPDESRARTHGGAGLGLALCKELAAAHGGTLKIESEPGRGTIVTVELPAPTT